MANITITGNVFNNNLGSVTLVIFNSQGIRITDNPPELFVNSIPFLSSVGFKEPIILQANVYSLDLLSPTTARKFKT
jgi:hypothetical protein